MADANERNDQISARMAPAHAKVILGHHRTAADDEQLLAMLPHMRDSLRAVVHEINSIMDDHHAANIMAMWRLGQLLHEIETNPDNYLTDEQKTQHVSPTSLVFQVYQKIYTPDQFDSALNLFEQYSATAIVELINRRCPTKPTWRFTASHVQLLLTIPDPNQREVFAERCVHEAYTTKTLAVELTELHGKKKKEGTPRAAKGLKQRVYDLLEQQRKFIARSEKLWLEDGGLYDDLMNTSPTKITDTVRGYLTEISDNFEKLRSIVEVHQRLCNTAIVRVQNSDTDAAADSVDDTAESVNH